MRNKLAIFDSGPPENLLIVIPRAVPCQHHSPPAEEAQHGNPSGLLILAGWCSGAGCLPALQQLRNRLISFYRLCPGDLNLRLTRDLTRVLLVIKFIN